MDLKSEPERKKDGTNPNRVEAKRFVWENEWEKIERDLWLSKMENSSLWFDNWIFQFLFTLLPLFSFHLSNLETCFFLTFTFFYFIFYFGQNA